MEPESEQSTAVTLFVGRTGELLRLGEMVAQLPATVLVGLPGVGKSALAAAFAQRWSGVVVRQRCSAPSLSRLLDEARRLVPAKRAIDRSVSDAEAMADFAARLAAVNGLWLLDDFHVLGADDQAAVLDGFSAAAGAARLIAIARQTPLQRAGSVDHAQLRVEPLGEQAGRELWQGLDVLYGPSDHFDVAWARSHGLPQCLRQAHAGGFDQEDPIVALVRSLDEHERWLAGALALSESPLPAEALLAERPVARASLRRLISRLVAHVDGAGLCSLHELFGAAVRDALDAEEQSGLHRVVAHLLQRLPLDPALRAHRVCAHLLSAGRAAEAADWLVHEAAGLVREGATDALLRAIDSIPLEQRTRALRFERARALLRVLDFGRALTELRALASGEPSIHDDLASVLAQVALHTGDVQLARQVLEPILNGPEAGLRTRTRAAVTLAVASCYLGDGDGGRRRLAELEPRLDDADEVAMLTAYRAFTFWIEERDSEASDAVRMVKMPAAKEPTSYRATALPAILGVIASRDGRFDDADGWLTRSQRVLELRSDLLFKLELAFARALNQYEAGERIAALDTLLAVDDRVVRAGYMLGTLYVGCWLARVLMVLGRRAEALDRLARNDELAHARGLRGVLEANQRSRRCDPVEQMLEPQRLPSPKRRGLYLRARLLAAVQDAAAGDAVRAREQCRSLPSIDGPGYALDRALVHVVDAVIARLEGNGAAVDAALERAAAEAVPGAPDAFDSDLPRALLDAAGQFRIVTAETRRLTSWADSVRERAAVVIDARTHELVTPEATISLRGRPVVRRLLYALAARAGRPLSKEQLAPAMWERDYSPLAHDNPLKSNVGHLRRLVANAGIVVSASELGYCLELGPNAVYIDRV